MRKMIVSFVVIFFGLGLFSSSYATITDYRSIDSFGNYPSKGKVISIRNCLDDNQETVTVKFFSRYKTLSGSIGEMDIPYKVTKTIRCDGYDYCRVRVMGNENVLKSKKTHVEDIAIIHADQRYNIFNGWVGYYKVVDKKHC